MKNLFQIMLLAFITVSIACNDSKKTDDKAYNDYKMYVTEHHDRSDQYYDRKWDEMDAEYKQVRDKAEADKNNWSDERKAEYENMNRNWDTFRENHTAENNRRSVVAGTKMIMGSVLTEGIREDMSNVTNENVLAVYKQFVGGVRGMKDNLTREQWDYVEILWERLDTRKNELENDMKTTVKLEIAEEKVEYGTMKATNRPVAKSDENMEAKEEKK